MAKELAHFKNFAKLKDAKVAFNDITVIAGKPGTGKSYVMKMMYAFDEAFSSFQIIQKEKLEILQKFLDNSEKLTDKEKLKLGEDLLQELKIKNEQEVIEEIELGMKNLLNSIFTNLNQISNKFSMDFGGAIIKYDNKTFKMSPALKSEFTKITAEEVIFVETPLILEFKKFMKREKGKTPYHIESLLNILDTDYSFTDEEQDEFITTFTQKSKEIIKGDIESSGDSFIFNKEDDKNYDIVNASSGTKSIGLLQYLVTNKALKKGSVLYWEEPEVHLHPEWQLRMIELFVELMNAGVKIVFSTHSPYMCDYLNAISQKKGFDDRVSFNLFEETDGVVNNHILESDEDWNKIQAELLDPLEEIMWEYI
jgi:predicted ATPase